MKAALISLGSVSSKLTAEAMRKYFNVVDELNIKKFEINLTGKTSQVLYEGKPLGDYDCIYVKGSFRYAPMLSSITTLLCDKTYLPISSKAFTVAHDKLLTQLDLGRANIPMPKTYLSSTIDAAKEILEKTNYPIIMKFPQGTQGKGVMFAESYATASSILDALGTLKQAVIIQEYIETGTSDIRVIVVGDKVAAAMKRKGSIKVGRKAIKYESVSKPKPGVKIVYAGDCLPGDSTVAAAKGADLLIHEATYASDHEKEAREHLHSTASQAAELALRAGVKRLVLTHISPRYKESGQLLKEAKEIFANTEVAEDGTEIIL